MGKFGKIFKTKKYNKDYYESRKLDNNNNENLETENSPRSSSKTADSDVLSESKINTRRSNLRSIITIILWHYLDFNIY
jgi:hypothetical protein